MHGVDYGGYAYGFWTTVVFSILIMLFVVFSFVKPKHEFEWRSMGAFIGFIVALFTEMYGFPLTIYLLTSWLGNSYPVLDPFSHSSGHLWLVLLGLSHSAIAMSLLHLISNGIIFFGIYVIYKGWSLIHKAGENELVTGGIYSRVRHPQYSGMWLISIAAWLFAISTMISWSYYGEQGIYYLFGKNANGAVMVYKVIYCLLILLTTVLAMPYFGPDGNRAIIGNDAQLDMWTTLGLGVMLVANIPIMWIFGAKAMKAYHGYFKKIKEGGDRPHEAPRLTDVVEGKDVE